MLYLVVAEPAWFGRVEVVGTFTAGFALDDAVARELAGITNSHVSFLCPRLCGSSLSGDARDALSAASATADGVSGLVGTINATPAVHTMGLAQYVGSRYSLGSTANDVSLVLLKDWAPTAQALTDIDWALGWAAAVTLGVGIIGAIVYSRRVARPLMLLPS